ncbi:DUF1648 domain-containing protein [Algoriphagus sp.]|uniref:DUF1648 domain-containing protein n=1 Tax=Algoriphagus sp. TaxID=1872435 RepID=UPI0032722FF2
MEDRPQIKLKLRPADILLEMLASVAILAIWGLAISHYSSLPDTIPTHFNAAGQPDDFGGKATLFILPILSTILFIGLTLLNRHPEIFNYPVDITLENASAQYKNIQRMMRYLKMVIVMIFGAILYRNIQIGQGIRDSLGSWFLPITLTAIFIVPLLFLINSARINKKLQNK